MLRWISEVDRYLGRWSVVGALAPERLAGLLRIATIESVGSSTRIEGSRLSDAEVADLLGRLETRSLRSRDEEEVAGYAYVPYASLEAITEQNKEAYYQSLRRTQTTLRDVTPDWESWMHFFLRCLQRQTVRLEERLA